MALRPSLLACALCAGLAWPLAAEPTALRADLGRLAGEVGELRRVELAQADPTRMADVEIRLGRIEEELRRLTGRLEEVEFRQRQLGDRLDRLVGDVDDRLRGLEGRPAGPVAGAGDAEGLGPEVAARAEPPLPPLAPAVPPATGAGERQLAPDEQVLGRIPADTVRGLPLPGDDPPRPTPSPPATGAGPALGAPPQFDSGMSLLRAGEYAAAEEAFRGFVDANPDDPQAAHAAYWVGETQLVRRDYSAAAAQFARNFSTYGPDSPRAADNLLKLGMSLHALGDDDRACQTYAELVRRYPDAPTPIQQAAVRERSRARCG